MMKNTKARRGEFDALDKARPDEVMFTLLDRDPAAPATILHWVELRRKMAREIADDEDREAELRQISAAEEVAWTMQDVQKGNVEKDAEKGETYSGLSVEHDALDQAIDKLRYAMREADYHAKIAVEQMDAILKLDRTNEAVQLDEALAKALRSISSGVHELTMRACQKRAAAQSERDLLS